DGFYGLMKFAEAAALRELPTVYGVELSVGKGVLAIARGPEGYRRLSRLVAQARMATGEKDEVYYPPRRTVAQRLGEEWITIVGHEWAEESEEQVAGCGEGTVDGE